MRVTTLLGWLQAGLKVKPLTPENLAAAKTLNIILKREKSRITFTNNSERLKSLPGKKKKPLRNLYETQLAKTGFSFWLAGEISLLGRPKEAFTIIEKRTNEMLDELLTLTNQIDQEFAKEALSP